MIFINSASDKGHFSGSAYYLCFSDNDVWLNVDGDKIAFPLLAKEQASQWGLNNGYFFGCLDNTPCYTQLVSNKIISQEYQWGPFKEFYINGEYDLSVIAGHARQLADWSVNFRFCGRCASITVKLPNEHARKCDKCGLINYPRISPAVITAVINKDQILLARGRHYQDKSLFSVLAGFVEPGESLEEAVHREIKEEVGIDIADVEYFRSQSWPFPDSLMIGFTANYKGGHIQIDTNEIAEAGWFKSDALPKVPVKRSLASALIQRFVLANSK